jgi:hypothetical protein
MLRLNLSRRHTAIRGWATLLRAADTGVNVLGDRPAAASACRRRSINWFSVVWSTVLTRAYRPARMVAVLALSRRVIRMRFFWRAFGVKGCRQV